MRRKEDDRYMRGRGEFVGDIRLAGMQEVAFLRSPVAHARLQAIHKPEGGEGSVFIAADLDGVKAIRAVSALPGFKISEQPVLAADKLRIVGELMAACVAPNRAAAEDLADSIEYELEELPAVHDMLQALQDGAPLVHEEWGDNIFQQTFVDGDIESVRERAAVRVEREYRTSRQSMAPMEGRGVVAVWDRRLEQLLVYTSTQMP
ncbi:MAG: molybdopterin-dependent oxidoreductase, partial [Ectothiorhodospiraceae bacterium]|nr:molybdopterin-dependent oxidoreductase [Ectothiorhodospiraceae bacterium]